MLEKDFYWPTVTKDVCQYVLSCDICQRLLKGSKLPIACLYPLPILDEAFKGIDIDIFGPLPV